MLKNLVLIIIGILFISSCNDDQEPSIDFTEIDALTGIRLLDINGAPIGVWNEANDNPGSLTAFPNPSNGIITIAGAENLKTIHLTETTCGMDSITQNISELSLELSFSTLEISVKTIESFNIGNNSFSVLLNLQDQSIGFYKIFFELLDGSIFWQNIYIDPNITNFIDLSDLDLNCM